LDVEHRFAKKLATALAFNLHQAALDSADTGGADIAVLGGELAGVNADVLQHGAQVWQVEQQQAVVVGDLEDQIDDAGLGLVETVLPVPVAPVIRPWRFANSGSSKQVVAAFLAIRSGSAMVDPVEFGGISAVRQAKSKMHR
jgi:hypothetical protein